MVKCWVATAGIAAAFGAAMLGWRLVAVATPTLDSKAPPGGGPAPFTAHRLEGNPIVHRTLDPGLAEEAARLGYVNINGPSLIRVPAWVEKRLGEYYLYFAHHKGASIRLAYADRLTGPWRIHPPGAMRLEQSRFTTEERESAGMLRSALDLWRASTLTEFVALAQVGMAASRAAAARRAGGIGGSNETRPHIASPEVIVDHARREIRMYFHGLVERRLQMTRVAVSPDGREFRVRAELITAPYLRVFELDGATYGLAMPGLLYRSADGISDFTVRRRPLLASNTRHVALWRRGRTVYVFFTRVGDAPERILCSLVDVANADWNTWKAAAPFEILRPELPWEGADLPVEVSMRGESPVPVRQLRDPAIFLENGVAYLLYAAAGEQAIAIARLEEPG